MKGGNILNAIKEAHGLITEHEGQLLFSLANDMSPQGVIVEIGLYKGGSTIFLAKGWKKPIRLLWIDGSHKYEHAKMDFLLWEKHLVKGGIIAFHDTQTSTNVDPTTGFRTGGTGKKGGPARIIGSLRNFFKHSKA